ncbi:MAG: YerC/YecD family TrpR-related protein [Patescibacteria group bacterium]
MARRRFSEDEYRQNPWFRQLCQALLSCRTEAELADFLRDIATLPELQSLGERLEVAKQLAKGKTYRDIVDTTGASSATISRVYSFLSDGAGGYKRILKKEHTGKSPSRVGLRRS